MLTYFRCHYGRYGPPDGQGYTRNKSFTPYFVARSNH